MTEENKEVTGTEKALASQGATVADTSQGQGTGGASPAPKDETGKPVEKTVAKTPEELAAEKTAADAVTAAAAKAATDKANAAVVDAAKGDGVTQWVKLEDPAGQAVIDLLTGSGVTPLEGNAIFNKAVESGNLDDVDWNALEKKLTPGQYLLARAGVEKYYNDQYAPIAATVAKGHELVGGEANWNLVKDWAQKTEATDPKFKATVDEIRKGIAQNGWIAEQSILRLKGLYEAAAGNKGLGVNKIVQGNTGTAAVQGDGLSRDEYMAEMHKLHTGYKTPAPALVAALRARRAAGRAAGI